MASGDAAGGDTANAAKSGADTPTLEDSEKASAQQGGDGSEGGTETEADVLQAAVEAMGRAGAEPSLDDAAAASGAGDSASNDAQAGASGGSESGEGVKGEGAAGGGAGTAQGTKQAAATGGGSGAAGNSAGAAGTSGGTAGHGGSEAVQLNRELNESLARFDGALLGERERIQARAEETGDGSAQSESTAMLDPEAPEDHSGDYGSVQEGKAPASGGGGGGGGGPSTENDTSSGSGMSAAGGGKGRKGDYQHTASASTVPPDIPDGSDDDVVARQIREAAMKEKDPELREKLWDEYRKYVNSTKAKS